MVISNTLILVSGSTFNIEPNIFFAPSDRGWLKSIIPYYILLYNSVSVLALNGKYPYNNANITIPIAHTSALSPRYSVRDTISGAIYDGVPQNIFTFFSNGKHVENPKSISFGTVNDSSSKIFSNLISLWHIDLEWRYYIAYTICAIKGLHISSDNRLSYK